MNPKQSFFLLFCALFNPLALAEVATFQKGVTGYEGCKSIDISDLNLGNIGNYNENGMVFADGNSDWCIGYLKSSMGYDISTLMRFEGLTDVIPEGSTIIAANLTLHFYLWDSGARVIGRYLINPWYADVVDNNGGVQTREVGWRNRLLGVPWNQMGATGEGTDIVVGKQIMWPQSGTLSANGLQHHTAPLDVSIVQQWIDNPSSNVGISLQVDVVGTHVGIVQCQRNIDGSRPVTMRPLLSIEYSSDGSVSSTTGGDEYTSSTTGSNIGSTSQSSSTTGNNIGSTSQSSSTTGAFEQNTEDSINSNTLPVVSFTLTVICLLCLLF